MRQNIFAFTVQNISVISAEVSKQNEAVIRSVPHEVFMQMSLETSAVKIYSLPFLRSSIVIYEIPLKSRSENVIADDVIDGFICHSIASDITRFSSLTDKKVVAR